MSAFIKLKLTKKRLAVHAIVTLVSSVLFVPILIPQCSAPVYYHQFEMQKLDLRRQGLFTMTSLKYFRSLHSFGRAILFSGESPPTSLETPEVVFDYLFSFLPSRTYVLPTEQLHYFRTTIADQIVAGNIRVADLDKGRLSMVYYALGRPSQVRAITISSESHPSFSATECSGGFRVRYKGRCVRFLVPATIVCSSDSTYLMDSEQSVGLVHDESGQRFWLIYNNTTQSLYYLVAPEYGLSEEVSMLSNGLLLGRRTSFLYYRSPGSERLVLVGVRRENLESNNYYDGPGDQVPIHIKIRDLLYIAYPGAKLKGGVDEYGVLLKSSEWSRYAICSYHRYSSNEELMELIGLVEGVAGLALDEASATITRERWNNEAWRDYVQNQLTLEFVQEF